VLNKLIERYREDQSLDRAEDFGVLPPAVAAAVLALERGGQRERRLGSI
jgi:hypothetical protein